MDNRADQQFAPNSEMPYFPHVSQGEPIVHGIPSFTPILPPPSPNQVLHSDDSKRRAGIILLIAAGAILLVLLVPTSFILLNGARSNPSTPYPTNTPVQQIVQQSTPPFATSAPTPVQRQLSSQQTQSQTASATGSGTTAATQATGTLKYCDQSFLLNTTVNKGTTLSNKEHTVMVVVDATLTTKAGACATGPGHVVQAGSIGNIAAQDMLQFRSGTSYITNDQPFSGGQNAQTYAVVQQSDIDGAAGTLTTLTTQTAETNIQQQLHGNEHLVGNPQCTSNVTADHNPGDRVSQVTVTGTTTCTATAST